MAARCGRHNPSLSFAAGPASRRAAGRLVYADSQAGKYLFSVSIARLICVGARAEVSGSGFAAGSTVPFTLQIEDGGPNGAGDTFAIRWPGYEAAGPLTAGNVLIRTP